MPFPVGQAVIAAILGAFLLPWILAMFGKNRQTAGY